MMRQMDKDQSNECLDPNFDARHSEASWVQSSQLQEDLLALFVCDTARKHGSSFSGDDAHCEHWWEHTCRAFIEGRHHMFST